MTTVAARQFSSLIDDLINRIVEAAHPLRIILFGSTARGEAGIDSDIDVLVVMPDGTHRSETARQLYRQLSGFGSPIDIVVATPSLLEQHKDNRGLIYRNILTEGQEIYVAQR
jgi:predicted nucleotidyltransferase